jgi:uncharacterized membrane protein
VVPALSARVTGAVNGAANVKYIASVATEHDALSLDIVPAERMTFFSDAVVAIAITLLALDLPVPQGATMPAFWSSIRHSFDHYLAFVISFWVIATMWTKHHRMLSYMKLCDARVRSLNFVWLFAVVVTPFATRLLTGVSGDSRVTHACRFSFYSSIQVMASIVFMLMIHHLDSSRLMADDIPDKLVQRVDFECWSTLAGFGVSIPIFFLTNYAWILWFLGPMLLGTLFRLVKRKARREEKVAGRHK